MPYCCKAKWCCMFYIWFIWRQHKWCIYIYIFDQCGILQQIKPGDSLRVDKGFTIQHILLTKQTTIFIPPFLGKRDAFTKEEVMLNKRIAKARIHVERFNECLKKN